MRIAASFGWFRFVLWMTVLFPLWLEAQPAWDIRGNWSIFYYYDENPASFSLDVTNENFVTGS